MRNYIKQLFLNDRVQRVLHTIWQAVGGALIASLLAANNGADVKAAVFVAATTALAIIKNSLVTGK